MSLEVSSNHTSVRLYTDDIVFVLRCLTFIKYSVKRLLDNTVLNVYKILLYASSLIAFT